MKGNFTIIANAILESTEIDGADKGLLACLRMRGNPDGSSCYPSVAWLAQMCGRKKPWVMERIEVLETLGFLRVSRRCGVKSTYLVTWPKPVRKNRSGTSAEKPHTTKNQLPRPPTPASKLSRRTGLKTGQKPLLTGILPPHKEP